MPFFSLPVLFSILMPPPRGGTESPHVQTLEAANTESYLLITFQIGYKRTIVCVYANIFLRPAER